MSVKFVWMKMGVPGEALMPDGDERFAGGYQAGFVAGLTADWQPDEAEYMASLSRPMLTGQPVSGGHHVGDYLDMLADAGRFRYRVHLGAIHWDRIADGASSTVVE